MNHMTVAASEKSFQEVFNHLRDGFNETASGGGDFGPFSASYDVGVRLEGGTIELQNNNTVLLSELDIVYDPLILRLGIDIPEICVGGFCLIPTPFGCILRVPRICIFSADPDIQLELNLSVLIQSEISGAFSIDTRYFVDPARPPGMSDHDAQDLDVANKWQLFLNPGWLDIDLIDISDTVGNVLDAAIDAAVDGLLGWLPGWVRDLIRAILGPIVALIRAILDLADDIQEWLSNLLGVSLGLFNAIVTLVADYLANRYPFLQFEDPIQVLKQVGGLIPVKVPIRDLDVLVTDDEMVVSANVGN
jgi:hypothetical protein